METDKNYLELKQEIETQKEIAYTAGLLQGDITIRTLLESLAEGIVIINSKGKIVLINKRMEEMFGYSKMEAQGEDLDLFIPEKHINKHKQHLESFFEAPRIRPMGIDYEVLGRKKNGDKIPIEASLSFLEVETGKLGLAFISDISKRKIAQEELVEKNKQLDDFAYIVAHDLNTNVRAITGFSEMLLKSPDRFSDKELAEHLNIIAGSGRKMGSIIKELLLFSRMKKEDVELSALKMDALIQSAISRLDEKINATETKIIIKDVNIESMGYAPWVEEVWFNYIDNAITYGGKPPVIEIGSYKNKGYATYWVKDNGKGILNENLDLLFNEKDDARLKIIKGNGLGLSIVKKIIEKLDGHVDVSSEVDQGSIFSFSLPIQKAKTA